jgi:hypothetical protein
MVGKLFESYPKSVPLCYFLPYCFTTMNPLSCSVHCLSAFPRSLTSLSPSHELNGLHLFIYSFLALSCSYQVIKNKQSLYLATKKVNFLIVLLKTHCQKGDFSIHTGSSVTLFLKNLIHHFSSSTFEIACK